MDFLSSLLEYLAGLSVLSKTALAFGLLFVTTNVKSLPFVWHIRCFNGLIKHLHRSPHVWEGDSRGPAAIFQPIITASHAPLLECDFNGHKSSSTYLTDLDVSRLHLISCLFGQGIKALGSRPVTGPKGDRVNGKLSFSLGAIECSYRREIKPYGKYEMWTRVIAWDRKWLYIVSHFVKPGSVVPQGYTLSKGACSLKDARSSKATVGKVGAKTDDTCAKPAPVPSQAVYASAISKYVFKKGRLTLHPEIVLEASGLLPARPGGWATTAGPAPAVEESMLPGSAEEEDGWTWQMVEAENAAGLKLANNFAVLDGLFDVFTGSNRPALGKYSDLGV
ncbi:hypothetical protein BJ878DRAFT_82971 [Calycina marina]|uniref:Uncharacterized protein n=1 Tax=Calycina marina TaxID=1763456 RepID=A0A9P7Z9L4_9HELO|nr:hypothetical protein BJ878DRAFT_82971 [Calycina marina]